MSLDNIVDVLYRVAGFFPNDKNDPFSIKKKFLKNDKTSTLKIIISPRGYKVPPTDKILLKRLYKKGYSCLYYYISSSVLSLNPDQTVRNFETIKNQIKSDIIKLKKEYSFNKIDIITSSLGAVSACLIADGNNDVDDLFLIVPGSCLASSLWRGIRTRDFRNAYEKKNINLEKLKNIWIKLAPKNNISNLNNKNIFLAVSKADKVIPYIFAEEFTQMIKSLYPDRTTVEENKYLGHYFTVVKYYIFSKELVK